jgi:tetratricopeptide (TPR) repeat protein
MRGKTGFGQTLGESRIMKKCIKIFAAFDKEAEEDVVRFGDFLGCLNAQCPAIDITVFKSEKALCESLEHPQEKIDGELDECEYFLLILGSQSDDFALDKLHRAIERYAKTHGNPDIHIFVNTSNKGADDVITFFNSEKYEHYVERFEHNDTLNTKFFFWLCAKQKDIAYEVTDINGTPVIMVAGKPISGLVNFDALCNNKKYQYEKKDLIDKRALREKYREEMLNADGEERDDLWDEISALAKEIDELQNNIVAKERDTITLYQNYAKMTLESGYNVKLKRARECIEQGDLDRARKVLDPEGSINNLNSIANENEVLAERIEANKRIAEQEINILLAEIDRLKLDTENKNRFVEIEKSYANIEYFQKKLGLEVTVLFDWAYFLDTQNKHNEAMEKYTQELERCRKLAEVNPDAYIFRVADTRNNLAILQEKTNRFTEAETNYIFALDIQQKLAEVNPNVYMPSVASMLDNLANLQKNTKRYAEAEANYIEALKIRRTLAETNYNAYIPNVATTLNNLALLYTDIQCYADAEAKYTEALDIQRKLAEADPDMYRPNVATTLNNLAILQATTNRYAEAEANYTEALDIRRKLTEINYSAYIPDVATTLYNLARLQADVDRYPESETNYTEALEILQDLVKTSPDVYRPRVASTLYNLAVLYYNTKRYVEAEAIFTKALKIQRTLAEVNPDAYMSDVAETLNNLAILQQKNNHSTEAEVSYTEAVDIYRNLAETNTQAYVDLAETLNKLADFQATISHYTKAADNYTEARNILQGLAEIEPDVYMPYVATMRDKLAELQQQINHSTEEK